MQKIGTFQGEIVCFTGTLKNPYRLIRKEAFEIVRANGGDVSARLSRKTTVLVCGIPNPHFNLSRKISLAKERNIRILSMEEFFSKTGLPSQMSFAF